jgi:hypothetical protein
MLLFLQHNNEADSTQTPGAKASEQWWFFERNSDIKHRCNSGKLSIGIILQFWKNVIMSI